jgi:AcrR family transcriptional regulator
MELLDQEGIDGLSMRKLAARLEVGAPSLYWHVKNRDELVVLLIDAVYGEVELPEGDEAWRDAATDFARDVRATAARHPWLVSVLDQLAAAHLGPNVSRLAERLLGVFEGAGFELPEAERALNTLLAYVTGVTIGEAAFHASLARQGTTEQAWIDEEQRVIDELPTEHRRLREVAGGYRDVDLRARMDEDFEYGLARVLDGLEARLR